MRIETKEIDKYTSRYHEAKYVSEFIIYLMAGDTPVEAHLEFGIENRDEKVRQLMQRHMPDLDNFDITNQYLIN